MTEILDREDFWDLGVFDGGIKVINRFVYQGKGRPRKSDYCTVSFMQKSINNLMNIFLNGK